MVWDKTRLKALLRLSRHPLHLIEQEPWRSWIEARGGLAAVYGYLRGCALSAEQRELLNAILTHPNASAEFYADYLYISRRTYFRRLDELLSTLLQCLNAWIGRPPKRIYQNLPVPVTKMVGAEESVRAVCALLLRPDVRLVTLTGPGGIGKTRLAVEVAWQIADRFEAGVCFVPLASVQDDSLLTAQVAWSLRIEAGGDQSLLTALKTTLREQQLLLVLDNFEQLVPGPLVADLLASTRYLKVLITSREVLNLYGEHRFQVPLLPLPDRRDEPSLEQLQMCPAVHLFVDRAQAVCPDFDLTENNATAVVEVCRRLDGLPLAIELAAAQVDLFSPEAMLVELKRPLEFLRGGPRDKEVRHQALWNVVDWSYGLLDEAERALFRRLAIFANGWDVAAAAAVSQITDVKSGLEALVRKNLIRAVNVDGIGLRFEMLFVVREYAMVRLNMCGEIELARRRHAAYYLALVEEAEPYAGAGHRSAWMARIEQEHDNLRAALIWMLEQGEAEMALRLVGGAWRFWQVLNILSEGRSWIEQALALGKEIRTPARIKALLGSGWLAISQGSEAGAVFEEGVALAFELEERRFLPSLLQGVGSTRVDYDPQAAKALFEQSLAIARGLGDEEETAWALDHLGRLEQELGEYARSQAFLEESLSIFRKLGHSLGVAFVLDHLGRVMLDQENWEKAQTLLEEALVYMEAFGARWHVAWTCEALAHAIIPQGDLQRARHLLSRALRLHHRAENFLGVALVLSGFAALASATGNYRRSAQLGGAAGAILGIADPNRLLDIRSHGQRVLQKNLIATRLYLDEWTFVAAWMRGQEMTLEEAIAFALIE